MQHKILLLDDEASVLSSLERTLRKQPYELLLVQEGFKALELLALHEVSVIISDINMPVMGGIEFLERAADVSRESIKMVLSGYSDIDLVLGAINKGHVWRYLTKPWQAEDLCVAISNAVEMYEVRAERELLLSELEVKNKKLTLWGEKLENIVDQRTSHIKNELKLMKSIMEGDNFSIFVGSVLNMIGALFGTNRITLFSLADDRGFDIHGELDKNCSRSCQKYLALEKGAEYQVDYNTDTLVVPIRHDTYVLGCLCIKGSKVTIDEVDTDLESYLALTSIAMLHNAMKVDRVNMLDNIDKIMQEI